MIALEKQYTDILDQIKNAIQSSEILAQYLEEEDEEMYKALQDTFEPAIDSLHTSVADHHPLQLESLEKALLDSEFEGLFLPRILGYSVLRGEIDDNYKFRKPQQHFRDILATICNSTNFEQLKKRIGQTVQVGFSLSSDIWITNLYDSIENKKVKAFLTQFRNDKFRDLKARKALYENYSMQLNKSNFKSVEFPETAADLKSSFYALRTFIVHRASRALDNSSLMNHLSKFIGNEKLYGSSEFLELLIIVGLKYNLDDATAKTFTKAINKIAHESSDFKKSFFEIYDRLHTGKELSIAPEDEHNLGKLMVEVKDKSIISFFNTTNELHSKGFVHLEAIEKVREYYETHPGMSIENEVLRSSVLIYINKFLNNITPSEYQDYFEINKVIIAYLGIFNNERFKQEVKNSSMNFITKCMNAFKDKRSKDYQDIRKYVSSTFNELGFLTDKEITELFKTRRKKA